ncbi:hypothetical protein BN2537_14421 [Streptomyces venezuelae]|nr:hypothetical protein BN2537_14421 [Streptomyces venezuelae]
MGQDEPKFLTPADPDTFTTSVSSGQFPPRTTVVVRRPPATSCPCRGTPSSPVSLRGRLSVVRPLRGSQGIDDDLRRPLHRGCGLLLLEGLHDTAGDVERGLEILRLADDLEDVRSGHLRSIDPHVITATGEITVRHHPHTVDLDRLGSRRAQLLDGVEQHVGLDGPGGIADGQGDPGPLGGDRAGQDPELLLLLLGLLTGFLGLVRARLQLGALLLQPRLLVLQALRTVVELVEDPHQVLLPGASQRAVLAGRGDLDGQAQTEDEQQQRDDELGPRDPRRPQSGGEPATSARLAPTGSDRRDGRNGRGRRDRRVHGVVALLRGLDTLRELGPPGLLSTLARTSPLRLLPTLRTRRTLRVLRVLRTPPALGLVGVLGVRGALGVLGVLGHLRVLVLAHRPHARNTWRRMAAALEKIRMPSTTTTPVDSCAPTPSLSPRKTISAATTTFERNDTTKTLSTKIPSSMARRPPKTASRAATTAIGR